MLGKKEINKAHKEEHEIADVIIGDFEIKRNKIIVYYRYLNTAGEDVGWEIVYLQKEAFADEIDELRDRLRLAVIAKEFPDTLAW